MAKIQTTCPNCSQPLVADIHQLVDINQDPRLKELLLTGGLNIAQCPACGFQGQLPVPLVYHDHEKELLLTFTPPDPNKTMEEKESALAPLLKQVTDNLAPEDRKGYLFQPQAMLTMNNLVKNVLLADGITEEMMQKQQEQMRLLEKFLTVDGDQLVKEVKENQENIDRDFFRLFAEIAQRVVASRDEDSISRIQNIQDVLMSETEIGQSIKSEAEEYQAATQSLEGLGQNLTRASLLELILDAPTMERVKAYASLVRPAMDYEFFTLFTEKIEDADAAERKEMVKRRNLLLKVTQEIDKELDERVASARQLIDKILESESVEEALIQHINAVDQLFIQVLSTELKAAQESDDKGREEKINELLQVVQKLTSPPELEVIETLLSVSEDEEKFNSVLKELDDQLMQRVIDYLTSIISNYDEQIASGELGSPEEMKANQAKLKEVFNSLLRKSMEQKMTAG